MADAVGPVTLDEARDKIAELRASIAFQNTQIRRWHGMATEYQAWIDFYHAGEGDYADFLRKRLPKEDGTCGVGIPQPGQEKNHG